MKKTTKAISRFEEDVEGKDLVGRVALYCSGKEGAGKAVNATLALAIRRFFQRNI